MIYYNPSLNLWSDNLSTVPQQAAALRNKFAAWDRRGFPADGWVALTESLPVYDGSPLTGTKVRTIDAGGTTFSWAVDGVRWDQCIATDQVLENRRGELIQQLHDWWDSHPGIEVLPDIVLPIQEAGRNTNTAAFTLTMQINSVLPTPRDIKLVDVHDYTVVIPIAEAITALGTFEAIYYPISEHWDTTHKALTAATTIETLNSITIEP
jgi:hypothetical protein